MIKIIDWPKTQCVYERELVSRRKYLVKDEILEGMDWVFDEGVRAVDKLHGTNGCIFFEKGKVKFISNRKSLITEDARIHRDMTDLECKFVLGFLNGMQRGFFKDIGDGHCFGELVGPSINGNIHGLVEYYFVPFDFLKERLHWKSWIQNKYDKNFDTISEWFKEMPSLFTQKYGYDSEKGKSDFAEGLVFWHPDGRRAKLRRDMFDWYYES